MKRKRSLSARLLGLFFLTALLLVMVVRTGFQFGSDNSWWSTTRPHLVEYAGHILDEVGDPPNAERLKALEARLPISLYVKGDGLDWSGDTPMPHFSERHMQTYELADGRIIQVGQRRGEFLMMASVSGYQITVVPQGWGSREGPSLAGIFTIIGVLLVLVFSYYMIRRLFKPIDTIRAGVARFGAGDLDQPIAVIRNDELGDLTNSVNKMAEDIQAMLEAKRQLLLAISHELRSPLTRAKVNLALLDESASQSALGRDLDVIETLIAELLETERLNSHHAALNRESIVADERLQEMLAEFFPDNTISTNYAAPDVVVSLDLVRFKLLARNLLENALRHTPQKAASPTLSTGAGANDWWLEVRDFGPGIAKAHLPYVTEPFYRADPSRRRATGGYGLGLYLCRVIAEAHGGELTVESQDGEGTCIRVSFPRAEK